MTTRKPYYWTARAAWYVNVLKNDRVTKKKLHQSKRIAFALWRDMVRLQTDVTHDPLFRTVASAWTEVQQRRFNRREVSAVWLDRATYTVCKFTDKFPGHRCSQITADLMDTWLATMKPNYARTELATIKQVLRWAQSVGRCDRNPLAAYRGPSAQPRITGISIADHAKLCKATDNHFRPLLRMAWLTGCRPGELRLLRWDQLSADYTRATLTEHKTARKTRRPRVIFFSRRARVILMRTLRRGEFVFLNSKGLPWTKDAVVLRMRRLREKTGVKAVAYNYRHGWITRSLVSGLSPATVGALAGTGVDMVARVYGHVDEHAEFLRQQNERVK